MVQKPFMKSAAKNTLRKAVHASMHVGLVRRGVRRLARAGLVPRKIWNRLPIVEPSFAVALPDGGSFRYCAAAGDAIGHAFYWAGVRAWEAETIRVFLALARRARRVLDIGANTGAYSLLACTVNPDLCAIAYEPVPRVFERLVANIECNGLAGRLTARQVAVSDGQGVTQLHVPRSLVPSSASLDQHGFRNIAGELIEVEVTTADHDTRAISEQAGSDPSKIDLVKIDVEGFEDRVLAGMPRILAQDRPVVICECNPDGPYRAVEEILAGHDYNVFHVRESGPVATAHIAPDPTQRFRNFACVPAEDADTRALLTGLARL